MIDRKEFMKDLQEERAVRLMIRHGIGIIKEKRREALEKERLEEKQLRKYIRKLIEDVSSDVADSVQHENTGIVVLDQVLKATIKQVEEEYKALTTKREQRDSFAAHFLATLDAALAPVDANRYAPGPAGEVSLEDRIKEAIMEEIGIQVSDEPDESKFIPARPEDEEEAKEKAEAAAADEEKSFQEVPGENRTGRNFAERAWNKVENQIIDAYEALEDPEDASAFRDYIITNFKLYFRKFEQELSGDVTVPVGAEEVESQEGI